MLLPEVPRKGAQGGFIVDCDTCGNRCKHKCAWHENTETGMVLAELCKFIEAEPEKKTIITDPGHECPWIVGPCAECHDISVMEMSEWRPPPQ